MTLLHRHLSESPPPADPPDLATPHTHTCPDCHQTHESIVRGRTARCPACIESIQRTYAESTAATIATAEKLAQDARSAQWNALCPPDYRTTAWLTHPELSPVCHYIAKHWTLLSPTRLPVFGPERSLLLYGPTGRGKTRCMFAILRRLHWSGIPCHHVEAVRFADHAALVNDFKASSQLRHEAQRHLNLAKRARVLFFDDLGKEGTTPGFARAFHDLLEHRKAYHLPTLLTSERVGDDLAQHLGTNYADGIVRRLRETCAIFSTEQSLDTLAPLTTPTQLPQDT